MAKVLVAEKVILDMAPSNAPASVQ
jgi:hypothetical protein